MSLVGQPVDEVLLSKVSNKVGTVVQSLLDETEFNNENPGTWKLMNGQSCVGTQLQTLTGSTSVPNLVSNGEFLRQAKAGRTIGSAEGDAIRNITGEITPNFISSNPNTSSGAMTSSVQQTSNRYGYTGGTYWGAKVDFDASRQVPTSSENRPKNVAVNHFIKTDY